MERTGTVLCLNKTKITDTKVLKFRKPKFKGFFKILVKNIEKCKKMSQYNTICFIRMLKFSKKIGGVVKCLDLIMK